MSVAVLIVILHGQPPMDVRPFPSMAECEHARRLVFEVIKTSTTRYRCVPA